MFSLKSVPWGVIGLNDGLVPNKPLSKPMIVQMNEAYMRP